LAAEGNTDVEEYYSEVGPVDVRMIIHSRLEGLEEMVGRLAEVRPGADGAKEATEVAAWMD